MEKFAVRSHIELLGTHRSLMCMHADMNFAGCQRKFDVAKYIAKWKPTNQDIRALLKRKAVQRDQ